VATRLPDIMATLYCSDAYAARHGAPSGADAIRDHDALLYAGTPGMEVFADWLAARAARVVATANAPEDMVGLLLSGLGIGLLPCFLGDATPGLRRCFEPPRD